MDIYAEGVKGEVFAKQYLESKGYVILDTNVSFHGVGELDIVAKAGDTLVFVEVRTRSDNAYGHPFETVTKSKIRKIVKASRRYLAEHFIPCKDYRYDVIAILRGNIEHLENAFLAYW